MSVSVEGSPRPIDTTYIFYLIFPNWEKITIKLVAPTYLKKLKKRTQQNPCQINLIQNDSIKQKYKGMHTFQLGWRSTNGGGSLKLINVSASGTQPWDTAWKIFPLRDGMLDKVSF